MEIVEGYFEDSLNSTLAERVGPVAFASLDADLYSSTLCVLRWLTPLLHTGSLLLFDEFLGEKGSEKKAFEEWTSEKGILTIKVAEFIRDPSGRGSQGDKRVLFQVVQSQDVLGGEKAIEAVCLNLRGVLRASKIRCGKLVELPIRSSERVEETIFWRFPKILCYPPQKCRPNIQVVGVPRPQPRQSVWPASTYHNRFSSSVKGILSTLIPDPPRT